MQLIKAGNGLGPSDKPQMKRALPKKKQRKRMGSGNEFKNTLAYYKILKKYIPKTMKTYFHVHCCIDLSTYVT